MAHAHLARESAVHGTNLADAGRTYEPSGPQRRHLAHRLPGRLAQDVDRGVARPGLPQRGLRRDPAPRRPQDCELPRELRPVPGDAGAAPSRADEGVGEAAAAPPRSQAEWQQQEEGRGGREEELALPGGRRQQAKGRRSGGARRRGLQRAARAAAGEASRLPRIAHLSRGRASPSAAHHRSHRRRLPLRPGVPRALPQHELWADAGRPRLHRGPQRVR
mmetsp:Transcript_14497/g.54748  ORF Transcript_14497/g.54748 Transcript_14497/m.54748 type:complete len:219 (+) Transcript_14497:883-1539(+)